MKAIFFNSHNTWVTHTETELELMQRHLDEGDEVVQLICDSDLPSCDVNHVHHIPDCLTCIGRREDGFRLLEGDVKRLHWREYIPKDNSPLKDVPTSFKDIYDLQAYYFDGFDVGFATCSSVISSLRTTKPDFVKYRNFVKRYLFSAIGVYRAMIEIIKEQKPDCVYVFNGRFAQVKAVLRACNKLGVECRVHERGSNKDEYFIVYDTVPHDIQYVKNNIKRVWGERGNADVEKNADKYFSDRQSGVAQSWRSFISDQEAGLLPEGFNEEKRNIVIFCSSEDEFISISSDFNNLLYSGQLDGVKKIIAELSDQKDIHLHVRMHPNMKAMMQWDQDNYLNLAQEGVSVIPPISPVSTYALLHHCEKTIVFGSTMGVEATYWGKPSVLLGRMFYEDLDIAHVPKTHEEAMKLILDPNLELKKKESTYIYAWYLTHFGTPFKYYQAEGLFEGKYRGVRLGYQWTSSQRLLHNFLSTKLLLKFRSYISYAHRWYISKKFF